ncbi:mitochondrial glyco protein [Morchella conica CCBAS932]|uniref:Mitochondrial glyco protein n=1 Tax=Morchella conica CCBAS932 TaxID=1392247 RepID=A0A3N4K7N0_9PEZI|nr:mitochondrial glyco protein [Morchella conica CCBAS932]
MFAARAISRIGRVPFTRFPASSPFARSISTKSQAFRVYVPVAIHKNPRLSAQFSTSFRSFEKEGTVDEELAAKIQAELELEKMRDVDDDMPLSVKEFLENGPFRIVDKPGEEEVELIRQFGDETIRIEFSIADLNATSPDELDETNLFNDGTEEDIAAGQSGGAQSKAAKAEGRVQTANDEMDEEDEEFDDETPVSFPSRVNVTIEKANGGALQFEAVAQDGMIVIDNVFYHKSAQLATAKTANADWERRGLYAGPPFGNLDEDLQVLLERYLDERGINTALALFIPDYIDYKEQKEYVSWLSSKS